MITVTMIDDKGNKWTEENYEGYGVFGGKDYYELLAEMNGLESDRQLGIDLAFDERKKGEVLFPALVEGDGSDYDWQAHSFYNEPESDPNQGRLMEDEFDYEEDEDYDDYYESKFYTSINEFKQHLNSKNKINEGRDAYCDTCGEHGYDDDLDKKCSNCGDFNWTTDYDKFEK